MQILYFSKSSPKTVKILKYKLKFCIKKLISIMDNVKHSTVTLIDYYYSSIM